MDDAGDCRYPDIFPPSAAEAFDSAFDISGSEQQVDDDMLSAAHFMLRPFMLRRVKADVEKTVPPKEEIKVSQSLPEASAPSARPDTFVLREGLLPALENAEVLVQEPAAEAGRSADRRLGSGERRGLWGRR